MNPYTHESRKVEMRTVQRFLKEDRSGKEPSYGEVCESYLEELMEELSRCDGSEESRRREELEERIGRVVE